MDIRYIAWAGYDLLFNKSLVSIDGPPDMDGVEIGKRTMFANEVGPSIRSRSIDFSPSIRGNVTNTLTPKISGGSDLRPFPKPNN